MQYKDNGRFVHRSRVYAQEVYGPCTVELPDGSACGEISALRDLSVCDTHAVRAYRYVADKLRTCSDAIAAANVRSASGSRTEENSVDVQALAKTPLVYYAQIGEHIKIGYTKDLKGRLRYYPPSTRLLAIEQGGLALEAERLRQFDQYRAAGDEWFYPAAPLMKHIRAVVLSSLNKT